MTLSEKAIEINKRITLARKALKLSQAKFGEKAGVGLGVIKNIDYNRAETKTVVVDALCRAHNINPIWVEDGVGEMFREASMSEDLVDFVGRVSCLPDDDFKKRFACALARLSEEDWIGLEHFIDGLIEKQEKDSE